MLVTLFKKSIIILQNYNIFYLKVIYLKVDNFGHNVAFGVLRAFNNITVRSLKTRFSYLTINSVPNFEHVYYIYYKTSF